MTHKQQTDAIHTHLLPSLLQAMDLNSEIIRVSRRKCLEGQRRGRQLLDIKYMWCRKGMHIS